MNEEAFNLSTRKFLKQFGVGAQREIERAVAAATADGRVRGAEAFRAVAVLRVDGLDLEFTTEGEITLG